MKLSASQFADALECRTASERNLIVGFIQSRAAAARKLGQRGQLTEIEAAEHGRWLETLAGDIAAGLHSEGA